MSANEKHSLLRGYLLGIGAPPEILQALDALFPPAAEEIQTHHKEQPPLGLTLDDLDISVRIKNCLLNEGITTIEDLVSKPPSQIIKITNFGWKSLKELQEELHRHGLSLAGASVCRLNSKKEYETVDYKHLVPRIKTLQKMGLDARQIRHTLPQTHEGPFPCRETIENIMNSKMYSEFEAF